MPVWPSAISFIAWPTGFTETGPVGNVRRSPMDKGAFKTRRLFTSAPRLVTGLTDLLTNAEIETFEDFYEDTLGGGVLRFDADHPRTGVTHSFRFVEDYEIVYVHTDCNRLRLNLEYFK